MFTRISAGVDDCPFFSTFYYCMILIDCKIAKFFIHINFVVCRVDLKTF